MEYERVKAVIALLSPPKKESLLPNKRNWRIVVSVSTIALLLYIIAFSLYITTMYKENAGFLLAIAIIENMVTAFSIIVSIIATHVSNYTNSACIRLVEKINLMNESISKTNSIDLNKKIKNTVPYIYILCAVIFSLYFVSSVIYFFNANIEKSEFISIALGSISTILTIVLALTTIISYFSTGKYFNSLLEAAKDNDIYLSNKNNDLKITISNKR